MTTTTKEKTVADTIRDLGLSTTYQFVPFSQSSSAKEKHAPSLNWIVTILRAGKPVLTCDYSAGCAHCPSYRQGDSSIARKDAVALECETGFPAIIGAGGEARIVKRTPIEPELLDVLYSLVSDAAAIEYGAFEDWADEMGFDSDSRKAEKIYRACLEIGLKLRAALGESGLQQLREAFQDY